MPANNLTKLPKFVGITALIILASIGWIVLLTQNPYILFKARLRYLEAVAKGQNLQNGPCLGKIADGWVLDIAHLPRLKIDENIENQCQQAAFEKSPRSHLVEMSPKGEIIFLK